MTNKETGGNHVVPVSFANLSTRFTWLMDSPMDTLMGGSSSPAGIVYRLTDLISCQLPDLARLPALPRLSCFFL